MATSAIPENQGLSTCSGISPDRIEGLDFPGVDLDLEADVGAAILGRNLEAELGGDRAPVIGGLAEPWLEQVADPLEEWLDRNGARPDEIEILRVADRS